MHVIARNESTSQVLGNRVSIALKPLLRMRGLMWRDPLEPGEGLWLIPGNSIHMFFVRFPLDILFLDAGLRIVEAVAELPPNRLGSVRGHCRASSVLELPAGTIARTGTQAEHVVSFTGRVQFPQ